MNFSSSALLPPYLQDLQLRQTADGGFERLRNIEIVNLAFRRRPRTATGGPNGVVLNVSRLVGNEYRGVRLRYAWEPRGFTLPERWGHWVRANALGSMARNLLGAHAFVLATLGQSIPRGRAATVRTSQVFVCHDIGSAAAAAMSHIPFVLVYHTQGSFEFERESFGEELSDVERELFRHFERLAFTQALQVHFPSHGARDVFFRTTHEVRADEVRVAEHPLYNAVDLSDVPVDDPSAFLHAVGRADLAEPGALERYHVVVSVGDFSWNKGLDRCPPILERLAAQTSKPLLWFALGSPHKAGIYERMLEEREGWSFDAVLSPARIPHPQLLGLVERADLFLMQHRNAIFDFGTLEAMALGTPVVLSPTGGNLEMNVRGDVHYVDADDVTDADITAMRDLLTAPKRRTRDAAPSEFSPASFANRYLRVYDDLIDRFLGTSIADAKRLPVFSAEQLDAESALRDLFAGKDVLIVGAGSSTTTLDAGDTDGKVVVALNSAVTLPLRFDACFRQDSPPDKAEFDAISPDTLRVYGRISRASTQHMQLTDEDLAASGSPLVRYLLSPLVHDTRHDEVTLDSDPEWVPDLRGVVFSAMYVAALFGAASVSLAGIDYSAENFNGTNPNLYNENTYHALLAMRRALVARGIPVRIAATTSSTVRHIVEHGELPPAHLIDNSRIAGHVPGRAPAPVARRSTVRDVLRDVLPPFTLRWARKVTHSVTRDAQDAPSR